MSQWLTDAEGMFEVARVAAEQGGPATDISIVTKADGQIHLISDSGWSLPQLAMYYGAQTAYRVSHQGSGVRVEARAGSNSCTLESSMPAYAARQILTDRPSYLL